MEEDTWKGICAVKQSNVCCLHRHGEGKWKFSLKTEITYKTAKKHCRLWWFCKNYNVFSFKIVANFQSCCSLWDITLSVACCGCASLSGQSQGQVLLMFCFLGRWMPSLTIPSHPIPFTPSLSECPDVWVAASSCCQLWGDCPECSLLSGEDGSCGCYSDPPMTHLAVDISKWK